MFKIMILLCMSVGPCFSAVSFEPGLTAREKQFVSECAAARYDIALLSAKVPEKPVVAGEAVTLVDLARTLFRMEMVMESQAEKLEEVVLKIAKQEQQMAGLRRQVAAMAAAAAATAYQQSWFEWLGLFAVGRQPILAFIFCIGGWEVAAGWHRLKWLLLACLCQPLSAAAWTLMVVCVWAGRKGCDPCGVASACCLGGCPLWRRGVPASDLLDLDEPAERGVGPVGAVLAALVTANSAMATTVEVATTVAAVATVAAGAAATMATALVAVPVAVMTVTQPRTMYRYVRGRSARLAAVSSSSHLSETGF